MEIQVKDMHAPRDDRSVLAVCDLVLDGEFIVKGVRVMGRPQEGGDSLFVAWPVRRDAQGRWHEVAFPLTLEAKERVIDLVLAAYTQLLIDDAQRTVTASTAKRDMLAGLERGR